MSAITVRAGSVSVKIYVVPFRGKKRYEVRDHFGGRGQTHRKKFTSRAVAESYAHERAAMMANGRAAQMRLTDAEAHLFINL